MASGSRDQTTRLWDLETGKELGMRRIDRNVVTWVKWVKNANSGETFLECSEDLTLRLWDVRNKPFKPSIEVKVGSNFATNAQILESDDKLLLATGHRGFNNEGAEIKLWDLTDFSATTVPLWTYTKHKFTPETVRFLTPDLLVSASKDQQLHLINVKTGDTLDTYQHSYSFSTMTLLSKSQILVAADVQQNIQAFWVDVEKRKIHEVFETPI